MKENDTQSSIPCMVDPRHTCVFHESTTKQVEQSLKEVQEIKEWRAEMEIKVDFLVDSSKATQNKLDELKKCMTEKMETLVQKSECEKLSQRAADALKETIGKYDNDLFQQKKESKNANEKIKEEAGIADQKIKEEMDARFKAFFDNIKWFIMAGIAIGSIFATLLSKGWALL